MVTTQRIQKNNILPVTSFLSNGVLQRKCACGNQVHGSGECEECQKKRLQRKTANQTQPAAVPPLVHDVLRSPGQSLDPATRAFMEPRFGHDFSQVRVHTDGQAAESARAVNALAYTVGRDVVFESGRYSPSTASGQRLLAHELAHVAQQTGHLQRASITGEPHIEISTEDNRFEYEANEAARKIFEDKNMPVQGQISTRLQRIPAIVGLDDAGPKADLTGKKEILHLPKYKPTEADKEEFELLKSSSGSRKDAAKFKTVEEYLEERDKFFGSPEAYEKAKQTADKEFEEQKLADLVGQKTDSQAARKVLYRWLRKAYIDAGVSDPPTVIKGGMTKELKEKIKIVQSKNPGIKAGGFAARPQKLRETYRLGTLSEHGLGNAVDIRPNANPQIPVVEWSFIEKLTGKTVDRSKSRWKKEPTALWQDVHDFNASYVEKLKAEIKQVEDKRAKEASPPKSKDAGAKKTPPKPAFEEVLKGNSELIKNTKRNGVEHGFFDLEKKLVSDLAEQDLIWGVTFPNPDLHHFEIE